MNKMKYLFLILIFLLCFCNKTIENNAIDVYGFIGGQSDFTKGVRKVLTSNDDNYDFCMELDGMKSIARFMFFDFEEGQTIDVPFTGKNESTGKITKGGKSLYFRKAKKYGNDVIYLSLDWKNIETDSAVEKTKSQDTFYKTSMQAILLDPDKSLRRCYKDMKAAAAFTEEENKFLHDSTNPDYFPEKK